MGIPEIRWAYDEAPLPVNSDGSPNHAAQAILAALALHCSEGAPAFPGVKRLSQYTKYSTKTVSEGLQQLAAAGAIKEVVRHNRCKAWVLLIMAKREAASGADEGAKPEAASSETGTCFRAIGKKEKERSKDPEVLRTSAPATAGGRVKITNDSTEMTPMPAPGFEPPAPTGRQRRQEPDEGPDSGVGRVEDPKPSAGPSARRQSPPVRLSGEFKHRLREVDRRGQHDVKAFAKALGARMKEQQTSEEIVLAMFDVYFANPNRVTRLDPRRRACWDFLGEWRFLQERAEQMRSKTNDPVSHEESGWNLSRLD